LTDHINCSIFPILIVNIYHSMLQDLLKILLLWIHPFLTNQIQISLCLFFFKNFSAICLKKQIYNSFFFFVRNKYGIQTFNIFFKRFRRWRFWKFWKDIWIRFVIFKIRKKKLEILMLFFQFFYQNILKGWLLFNDFS